MHLLLATLVTTAFAEDPADDNRRGTSGVSATTTVEIDAITFNLDKCEGIRAEFRDARAAGEPKAPRVKVVLHNATADTCLFKGLAFAGTLTGTYETSQRTPDGAGFYVSPGQDVELRLFLEPLDVPRDVIRMEIAPGRGIVVLIGYAAADAPPPGQSAPKPATPPAEPEPETKPKGRKRD